MRPYPIVIVEDRYGGGYSGGAWFAIAQGEIDHNGTSRADWCLKFGPNGGDVEARTFWLDPPIWIAADRTPDAAVAALLKKIPTEQPQSYPGAVEGRARRDTKSD
jgi:hypothetical protein